MFRYSKERFFLMKHIGLLVLAQLVIVTPAALAGQVLKITGAGKFRDVRIAHYGEVYYHWVINDEVCLVRNTTSDKLCGNVLRYDKVETVLRFKKELVTFHEGEEIKILYNKNTARGVASNSPSDELRPNLKDTAHDEKKPKMNAAIGLGTGFSYLFFDASFRYAITPKVSLGVMPVFVNDPGINTSVKAFGGFLIGDYYFREHFYGFKLEGGLGFYSITATAGTFEETSSPLAFYSTFGWRGKIHQSGLTVGGGAGFQIVANSQKTLLLDFSGFLPLLQLELGYSF